MAVKTSVKINARLVDEATKLLGAESRTAAVHTALQEIAGLRSFKKLLKKHASKLQIVRGALNGGSAMVSDKYI